MLHDPAEHEPLNDAPWDEGRARETIRAIVADAEAALQPDATWPVHPKDEIQAPHRTLYIGAAGVACALRYLAEAGAAPTSLDGAELLERIHAGYLAAPETTEPAPTLLIGEAGILLARYRARPSSDVADGLKRAIRANVGNPARELMWGAPGTMVAALFMLQWSGDDEFRELYLESAEDLWSTWAFQDDAGCHLWTQDLYGSSRRMLGAVHGAFGNIDALLRGAHLLAEDRREDLLARAARMVAATAVREDDLANWPPAVGGPKAIRVQWCHGAPGMVTALARFPAGRDAALEELLLAAGRMVWEAGPLTKGPGLCHGTAGNGSAFLKLHRRSGDPAWLRRARAFAMHACGQYRAERERHGGGRHTLFTGDPGLAVYLWHCITGEDLLPSLEVF